MQKLKPGTRIERRLVSPSITPLAASSVEEIVYPRQWVTTVYMGTKDGRLPKHATLRIRFFETSSHEEFFMLDPMAHCSLEIKFTHTEYRPDHVHNSKHTNGNFTIGKIVQALSNRGSLAELSHDSLEDNQYTVKLLQDFFDKEAIDGLRPVGASHYFRRHFQDNASRTRVTIDENLSLWTFLEIYGDFIGVRESPIAQTALLEAKCDDQNGPINDALERYVATHFDIEQPLEYVKFSKLESIKNLLSQQPTHRLITPDIAIMQEDREWSWHEQEIKIDVAKDPRKLLARLRFDTIGVVGGRTLPMLSHQYFLKVQPSGICIMQTPGQAQAIIKYKLPISTDKGGLITRQEKGLPFSPANLQKIIIELAGDQSAELVRTATFARRRSRRVVCCPSGNVFLIIADHCVSRDARPPLDQLEIEYVGYITSRASAPAAQDVSKDFRLLANFLHDQFDQKHFSPKASHRTKYQWISRNL